LLQNSAILIEQFAETRAQWSHAPFSSSRLDVPISPAMRARSQGTPKRLLLAATLVAVASLTASGCSAGVSVNSTGTSRHFGMGPPNKPLPPGEWEATGVVVGERASYSNEPVGTVLKRPWTFRKICNSSCHRVFFRQTLYGPSVTRLIPAGGGRYTAAFPPVTVPCYYTRDYPHARHPFGQSHDSYKLWWSANREKIRAVEHQTQTGCYRTEEPPSVTRWFATRNQRSAAAPAPGA
jgi:hypothetical protein